MLGGLAPCPCFLFVVVPSLSIPELRSSLMRSPDSLHCCRRDANLFWYSTRLCLSGVVPSPLLVRFIGGSGVPKLKWAGVVGCEAPAVASAPVVVVVVVPRIGACVPLPLGGSFVHVGCHVATSASSIVSSS